MAEVTNIVEVRSKWLDEALATMPVTNVPRAFRGLDKRMLATAGRLAGGDWRRVVLHEDGSLVIYNHRKWQPE